MDGSGKVVFMGEWKDGKGKGKEMDGDGNVVYEGEWWNGKRNGVGEVLKGTSRIFWKMRNCVRKIWSILSGYTQRKCG